MSSPCKKPILITGSNGFVAGRIFQSALEKGHKVQRSVRRKSSAAKLKAMFPECASQLSTSLVPDITVVENCEHALDDTITELFHCASPFSLHHIHDIRAELLDPAIGGAVTILDAVQKYCKNVRRVVTTASFASKLDVVKGLRGGHTYNEKDWNPMLYMKRPRRLRLRVHNRLQKPLRRGPNGIGEDSSPDVHLPVCEQ